jgi:hypothetical protein
MDPVTPVGPGIQAIGGRPRTPTRGRSPGGREGFLVPLMTTIEARVNPVELVLVASQRHPAKGRRHCRAGTRPAMNKAVKGPSTVLP